MKAFFFRKGHIFIGVYSLDNIARSERVGPGKIVLTVTSVPFVNLDKLLPRITAWILSWHTAAFVQKA